MRARLHPTPLRLAWVVALVLAVLSLFPHRGSHAWQTDEPVYRNAARAIFEYDNWSHNLEHPMVGKYLIGISEFVFGHDAWATRLPSAVAMLLAGLLLALLARRVTGTAGWGTAAAGWAGIATFATWTLLPHPDPNFDIARLAYLDAPMALFIAAAMCAGWRWQEQWSWRWAAATGVAAGLAIGTKLPALFLAAALLVLVVGRADAPRRRRVLQYLSLAGIAALTTLVTWAPLGRDFPRAMRFLAGMQTRSVDQSVEVAGRTYDGAPFWTQAWWQWDAWPAFALVQLVALVAVWWLLPRRAAAFISACVVLPLVAYAFGSRILPHWQATWQVAMAVLVGVSIVGLVRAAVKPGARGPVLSGQTLARGALAAAMAIVVLVYAGERLADTLGSEVSDQMRVARLLASVDQPDATVSSTTATAHVERSLVLGHVSPPDSTYHSAAESQHEWVTRNGGNPVELTGPLDPASVRRSLRSVALVTDADQDPPLAGEPATSRSPRRTGPFEAGRFAVWILED